MLNRYRRNLNALSLEEQEKLKKSRVCIAGCGALGEYVFEMLGRLGIENLTIIDCDVFEETNLNRQIYSSINNIGISKVKAAKDRMALVNPLVKVNAVNIRITQENAISLLKDHDVLVDALDNSSSKILLQKSAEKLVIPLVHGAIGGWYGQVSTIMPGDNILNIMYSQTPEKANAEMGNPPYTPALVAAIQVSEVVKILIGRGKLLQKKILYIDLLGQEYIYINL